MPQCVAGLWVQPKWAREINYPDAGRGHDPAKPLARGAGMMVNNANTSPHLSSKFTKIRSVSHPRGESDRPTGEIMDTRSRIVPRSDTHFAKRGGEF